MSLDMELLETQPTIKVRVGLHIISSVVPRILDDSIFIGERVALAYSWYLFMCKISLCPDVPKEMSKWGLNELQKVAEALIDYARKLLKDYLSV